MQECYICLGPPGKEPLVQACQCSLLSHPCCLARWQLTRAGKDEEHRCRFCRSALPTWVAALLPRLCDQGQLLPALHAAPAAHAEQQAGDATLPTMEVVYDGRTAEVPCKPGAEGLDDFKHQVREVFGLDDGMALDIMFEFQIPALEACLGMEDTLGQRCQVVCLQGFSAFDAASTVAAMYATADGLQVAGPTRPLDDSAPPPRSGTLASLLQAEPWAEPQTGRLAPGAVHHDGVAADQLQQASAAAAGRHPQLALLTGGEGADQSHQSSAGVRAEGNGMAALLAASASAPGAPSDSGDADAALQLAQLPSCFSQGAGWGVSAGGAADARGRTSSDTADSVADCGGSCSASSGDGGARPSSSSCSSRGYSQLGALSVDTPCLFELPQGVCRPLHLAQRRHKSLRHSTELADLRQRRGSLTTLYAPLLSALSCPAAALPSTGLASSPLRHSLPVCRPAGRAGRHASLHGHSPMQLAAAAAQAAQAEADRGPETTAGTAGVRSMRASDEWRGASPNQSPSEGLELPPDERRRLGLGRWSAPMHEGARVPASFVQPGALVDGWQGDAAAELAAQVDSVVGSGRGRGGDGRVAGASAEGGRAGRSPFAAPPLDQKAEKSLRERLVSWSVRAVRLLFA